MLLALLLGSLIQGPSAVAQALSAESVHALALPAGRPESFVVELLLHGQAQTLLLERHSLRGPGFRVKAWSPRGMQLVDPAPSGTYRGQVLQSPGSTVLASLTEQGLSALILGADGRQLQLRPLAAEIPGTPRELHALDHLGDGLGNGTPNDFLCASDILESPAALPPAGSGGPAPNEQLTFGQVPGAGAANAPQLGGAQPSGARAKTKGKPSAGPPLSCVTICELAFDCDFEYFQAKGSDIASVLDSVEAHMNQVDWYYARDTKITYHIPEVVVRTAPFYAPVSGGDLLNQFRDEWNTNQTGVKRDIAQLLTGKPGSLIEFGGLAFVGVMCSSSGYGWSMDNTNALGHEIGHNWGSSHCHDASPCNNMCGGCFYIAPNTKDIITATRDSAPCLQTLGHYVTPLPPYAHPESLSVRKDELSSLGPVAFDVLANDHDVNCQELSLESFSSAGSQGGALSLSAGTGPQGRDELIYQAPSAPFLGDDAFTYVVRDSGGKSAQGSVRVSSRPNVLAGQWKLDEANGTLASDSTTMGHDGTTSGGPLWTAGQIDGALLFDGLDDAVTLPALNLATDQLSITAWMRRSGAQAAFAGVVFQRAGSTVAGLNFGTNNELRYHWDGAAQSYNWNSGLVVPNATWVFVALVVEAHQATIYLHDGVLQSAVNAVPHVVEAFDGSLALGLDPGSNIRDYRGLLDDVRIYDHALDPTAVLDVYQHGGRAESPSPPDGGKMAEPAWGLSWLAGTFADSHDLYLGTDFLAVRDATPSDAPFQGTFVSTGYVPAGLVPDTTHYWRVDERIGPVVLPGEVWQFRPAKRFRWALDESSGTAAAESIVNQDGVYFGNPQLGLPGASALLGSSVTLDGVNDRMRADPLQLNTNTVSMTAWVRRDGLQPQWAPFMFQRGGTTAAGLGLGFGNELRYHWDGGQWPWDSGLELPGGVWTFVALSVGPNQATIAMSEGGVLKFATQSASHAPEAFDSGFEVGRDPGFSARWLRGGVDDVRVYAAELSQADLERLYTETRD